MGGSLSFQRHLEYISFPRGLPAFARLRAVRPRGWSMEPIWKHAEQIEYGHARPKSTEIDRDLVSCRPTERNAQMPDIKGSETERIC